MALFTAFIMGLVGSLHCIGMCGPIALSLPYHDPQKWKTLRNVLLYNSGRVLSYCLLGILPAILGLGVQIGGFQKTTTIVLGVLMIVFAFFSFNLNSRLWSFGPLARFKQWVQQQLGRLLKSHSLTAFLGIGLFNGLLPCGMVYAAMAGAVTQSALINSFLYMALFGLGTIPMMLALALAGNWLSWRWRRVLRSATPLFLLFFGALLLARAWQVELPESLAFWLYDFSAPRCH